MAPLTGLLSRKVRSGSLGHSSTSQLPGATATGQSQSTGFVAALPADASSIDSMELVPTGAGLISIAGDKIAVMGSPDWFLTNGPAGSPLLVVADSAEGLVSGTYASSELVSLYGADIGPAVSYNPADSSGANSPVQVLVNGTPASILYAGRNQINVRLPELFDSYSTASVKVIGPQGFVRFSFHLFRDRESGSVHVSRN